MKCKAKLKPMAANKMGLIHGGIKAKDWFSDKLLMALHISMVTRMDKAMVMGSGAWKMSQLRPLNFSGSPGHCRKCDS